MRKYDTANWDGINTTIFFSGCTLRCPGCFNQEAKDFNSGHEFTKEKEDLFIKWAKDDKVSGICILGGEPFQQDLYRLLKFVTRLNNEVSKPIRIWSGYKYEELINDPIKRAILYSVDTLIDGRFEIENKDLSLKFRGSTNQRVIDTYESVQRNEVVLYEGRHNDIL